MIRISKKVEYALMALKFISQSDNKLVTAREISDTKKIPYDLLSKILQKLKNENILLSNQGTNGGYSLNKRTDEIYLYNLMNMLDGDIAVAECMYETKEKDCSLEDSCSIKSEVAKLQKEVEDLFKNKTISDFV
ncbi:MAG TPA: Rrf2 family transcriptional regulator [Ignavibacteria bacterium]|nr:Rrf2 family transcriptional regulator [Ignavibacteria bacterium]HRJ99806.1 Rrf2 family transcriptional regulator [Ignavibacteria bacterium]